MVESQGKALMAEKPWQKQVTAEKTMHEFDPGSPAEGKERIPRKKTAGGFCDVHLNELAMKLKQETTSLHNVLGYHSTDRILLCPKQIIQNTSRHESQSMESQKPNYNLRLF